MRQRPPAPASASEIETCAADQQSPATKLLLDFLFFLLLFSLSRLARLAHKWKLVVQLGQQPAELRGASDEACAASPEALRSVVQSLLARPPTDVSPFRVADIAGGPGKTLRTLPADVAAAVREIRSRLDRDLRQWDDGARREALAKSDELTIARFVLGVPQAPSRAEDAYRAYKAAMHWHAERRVGALLMEFHPARTRAPGATPRQQIVRNYFYAGMGGVCRTGAPFLVERLGAADHAHLNGPALHGLMASAYVAHYELFTRAVRACSAAAGTLVFGIVVVDTAGIGLGLTLLRHLKLTTFAATAGTANFPEGVEQVMVVNAPRAVAAVWAAIKPLLPEVTQRKVHILSEAATPDALREVIDPKELPRSLGGVKPDAETAVPLALPVPQDSMAQ